ncbi:MAG TPA: dynamin family protein [Ktedonobacteraceae bacterium]|nr:dynamin family protein [Ktedonobacteraceae bacterium]
MQTTPPTQQLTTCPQCDNVVRVDAEVCNICGQRLRPASALLPANHALEDDDDYEDDDEYIDDEEYEDDEAEALGIRGSTPLVPPTPPSPGEIVQRIRRLQEQSSQIERYFPANLPGKEQKLAAWKKQIQRAGALAELLDRPQLQQTESQQPLKLRHHLMEAAYALDFTREYSVKLVGHAGAGKSTLLAALIGQDIFPRLAGGAVTGVCTRVRLCADREPEEMRVQFLTRKEFDALLRQTQQALKEATSQRTREALSAEYQILVKALEAFGEEYLLDGNGHAEMLPRERWKSESSRYIEEPARDSQEPRLVRLVNYVEYRVRAGKRAILPPGSVLVDLPGGAAGQIRHDAILREELRSTDAILLVVGNNRFGDDERTQHLFELVRRRVLLGRAGDVAARMVFLAVTHWDEITSPASQEKALGSLRPLLRDLPPNYASFHQHGPAHNMFFYPLRAQDGLLATLGLQKQQLDSERLQEGRDYAGRVLGVYPDLLKINPNLPATASAQDFQKVTTAQHEAMLRYSGLSELSDDLQTFLSGNRYDVQLRQAETQIALAIQQLEDLCWENLGHEGVQSRDLQELEQEMSARQSKRSASRFETLQQRTQGMHVAWSDALKAFDQTVLAEGNAFHQALQTAHDRAARRVKIRIMQGYLDHFIKVSSQVQGDSPALEIGNRWVDIDGWNLIKDLRSNVSAALERELHEPARCLAEAFLAPIAQKEEVDGSLDINRVSMGEFGGDLDEIHKSYSRLKRSIRDKARDVCLYVTISELLNEAKYAPSREDPAVGALYRLAATAGRAENIVQQARQLMGPILDVICKELADSTERRITHLFRYELDKLETRQTFESDRLDAPMGSQPGVFADLVNRLYSLLTERVMTSEALREQLDSLQARREADVDQWVTLLQEAETLKTAHRQPG